MKNKEKKSSSQKKVPLAVIILCWLFAAVALVLLALVSVCIYSTGPVTRNPREEVSCELKIHSGTSVSHVASELKEKGMIRSAKAFYYAARFNAFDREKAFNLRSGTYTVKNTMPLREIYELVQTGTPEYAVVSIPEGLTLTKTAALVAQSGICTKDEFLASSHSAELLKKYSIPASSFEGYLFPDTYYFNKEMDADGILCQMADNFFEKTASISGFEGKTADEVFKIITLASIVEREYRVASEAPSIAGVFTNRLKNDIGLESCATVEYVITEIQHKPHPKRIFYADLEIDSPYNTYKYAGLPPGPISNPGTVSLSAAASPEQNEYFYFVLNDPDKGTHTFSKTLSEHNKAAQVLYTKR